MRKCPSSKNQFKCNANLVGFIQAVGAPQVVHLSPSLFRPSITASSIRSQLLQHSPGSEWKGGSSLWNPSFFSSKITWKECSPLRRKCIPSMGLKCPQVVARAEFSSWASIMLFCLLFLNQSVPFTSHAACGTIYLKQYGLLEKVNNNNYYY